MAYEFTAASSQYLSATASPLGTGQLGDHTIALWVKGAAASPTTNFFSISRSTETGGVNNPTILIQNANGAVSYFIRGNVSPDGGGYISISGGTAFDNTSRHVCARLSSTTANVYANGTSVATATVASIPAQTGMDRLGVGALVRGNVGGFYNGQAAEVGIWNAALTADEVASLAKGMTCDKVRPQSLVFYAPLIRDLQDVRGGLTITNNNTATVANHPRVY
jgi:hypothetical protein